MTKRKDSYTMRSALNLICLIMFLLLGGYLFVSMTPLGIFFQQHPGSFDHARFDSIVQAVRASGIQKSQTLEFHLDRLSAPASLRRLKPQEEFLPGRRAGNVWAEMTQEGKLKVVIETRDLGHAGEYGYAYSEVPLSPHPFGEDWYRIEVPGRLNLVQPKMKIDNHWWEVLNNLD